MTPFEKLTGAATSVVFVAGVLAAVLLSGGAGVTVSAQGGQAVDPAAADLAGSSDGETFTTEGGSTSPAPTNGSAGPSVGAIDEGRTGDSVPLHRSTTTLLPGDALDLLDRIVGLIPDADLAALTDLLDSLDPSLLDDVLDELEDALDAGTLQELVDELLGEVDLPVPTTLPPLTVPDPAGVVDDTTGAVDDVVDDTTGAVDDVVDDTTGAVDDVVGDPTGTVDDVVGSITGSGSGADTSEDTADPVTDDVTDTLTDAVGGLL